MEISLNYSTSQELKLNLLDQNKNTWCFDNRAEVISFIWKLVCSRKKSQENKRINVLPKKVLRKTNHFNVTFALFTVLLG